jgi:hypothetical protein
MRIWICDVSHRPDGVFKLILIHFGNIIKKVVEKFKVVGKVEPHFIWKEISINGKKAVLINSKFVEHTFKFAASIIERLLLALDHNMGGKSESSV